jgi:outer membrane protein
MSEEDVGLDALMAEASKTRPELASFDDQIRSAALTIDAAKGDYFPSFGAGTSVTAAGAQLDKLALNWSGQLNVNWALFQGWLTEATVREARAQLAVVESRRDTEVLAVRLEVEQAQLAVRGAKAALRGSKEALVNAEQRLALAEGRYQTGVGNVIELGDAQLARTNAAAQEVGAEYNLATARAQLLRSLGRTR